MIIFRKFLIYCFSANNVGAFLNSFILSFSFRFSLSIYGKLMQIFLECKHISSMEQSHPPPLVVSQCNSLFFFGNFKSFEIFFIGLFSCGYHRFLIVPCIRFSYIFYSAIFMRWIFANFFIYYNFICFLVCLLF